MRNHRGRIRLLPVLTLLFTLFAVMSAYGTQQEVWITEDAPGAAEATRALAPSEEQALIDAKTGPGVKNLKEVDVAETLDASGKYKKGKSLGMYTTTGYCTCEKCSGGSGKTYSGTIPKANHTISADLDVLPLGTKVMIEDVVYTVEDKGSSIKGSWIDIYYEDHEEAVTHGKKTQEVFKVIEEK